MLQHKQLTGRESRAVNIICCRQYCYAESLFNALTAVGVAFGAGAAEVPFVATLGHSSLAAVLCVLSHPIFEAATRHVVRGREHLIDTLVVDVEEHEAAVRRRSSLLGSDVDVLHSAVLAHSRPRRAGWLI